MKKIHYLSAFGIFLFYGWPAYSMSTHSSRSQLLGMRYLLTNQEEIGSSKGFKILVISAACLASFAIGFGAGQSYFKWKAKGENKNIMYDREALLSDSESEEESVENDQNSESEEKVENQAPIRSSQDSLTLCTTSYAYALKQINESKITN